MGRKIKFAEGNFYRLSYSGNTQDHNTPNVNQASVLQTLVCFDKLSPSAARPEPIREHLGWSVEPDMQSQRAPEGPGKHFGATSRHQRFLRRREKSADRIFGCGQGLRVATFREE